MYSFCLLVIDTWTGAFAVCYWSSISKTHDESVPRGKKSHCVNRAPHRCFVCHSCLPFNTAPFTDKEVQAQGLKEWFVEVKWVVYERRVDRSQSEPQSLALCILQQATDFNNSWSNFLSIRAPCLTIIYKMPDEKETIFCNVNVKLLGGNWDEGCNCAFRP